MEKTVEELVKLLKESYSIVGETDRQVSRVSPISEATENSLSFLSSGKGVDLLLESKAGVIVCSPLVDLPKGKTYIQVDNPRLTFIRLLGEFFAEKLPPQTHPKEGTFIYEGVYIHPNTKIGRNVIIHSGVVIGGDGFGFEWDGSRWVKFPHIGGVIIEDDVEIQANSTIPRGGLVNTIIGQGTKIDALVHIGHNSRIGKHCFIAAGTSLGGSVTIGDNCWIGLNATIRDWVTLGNNVLVGMGAVVRDSFGDNLVLAGVPARVLRKNEGGVK